MLDKLPGKMYIINTIDQIPANYKYAKTLISLAQNRKQSKIGGLAKCLELKVVAKVMVTVNVGRQVSSLMGKLKKWYGLKLKTALEKVCFKFPDP